MLTRSRPSRPHSPVGAADASTAGVHLEHSWAQQRCYCPIARCEHEGSASPQQARLTHTQQAATSIALMPRQVDGSSITAVRSKPSQQHAHTPRPHHPHSQALHSYKQDSHSYSYSYSWSCIASSKTATAATLMRRLAAGQRSHLPSHAQASALALHGYVGSYVLHTPRPLCPHSFAHADDGAVQRTCEF